MPMLSLPSGVRYYQYTDDTQLYLSVSSESGETVEVLKLMSRSSNGLGGGQEIEVESRHGRGAVDE